MRANMPSSEQAVDPRCVGQFHGDRQEKLSEKEYVKGAAEEAGHDERQVGACPAQVLENYEERGPW